jgi:hypothetical protein
MNFSCLQRILRQAKEIWKITRISLDRLKKLLERVASRTSRAAECVTVVTEELDDAAHYQVTKFYLACGL